MAKITYDGEMGTKKKNEEDKIKQGDFVFCEANGGALDFWGIYSQSLKTIIALNGAGSSYIQGYDLYLNDTYNSWTIIKRISCDKVMVSISEA
jgi:hypothetical protein